jgi:phage protein D
MITTNLSPLGISWSFSIDGSPVASNTIQKISMSFVENQHDVATIEMVGVPSEYVLGYVDKPIVLNVSVLGNRLCSMFGYVSHIEGISHTHEGLVNGSAFQLLKVICFGSSYILKAKQTKVWNDVSLQDVVSNIADKHKIGYSIPINNYRFKRLIQSETSSWQFIVNTAKQLGYSCTLSNNHLHIWDKRLSPARQPSYATLEGTKVTRKQYEPRPGVILTFNPVMGNNTPVGDMNNNSISYIDELGQIASVSDTDVEITPTFGTANATRFNDELAATAISFENAKNILSAKKNYTHAYSCETTVLGDPSIKVGGIVKVTGYDHDFEGFWYVESVTHELFSETLLTHLKLTRDGNIDESSKFPVVQQYFDLPNPVLINNKWCMKTEHVNVYN